MIFKSSKQYGSIRTVTITIFQLYLVESLKLNFRMKGERKHKAIAKIEYTKETNNSYVRHESVVMQQMANVRTKNGMLHDINRTGTLRHFHYIANLRILYMNPVTKKKGNCRRL